MFGHMLSEIKWHGTIKMDVQSNVIDKLSLSANMAVKVLRVAQEYISHRELQSLMLTWERHYSTAKKEIDLICNIERQTTC